MASTLAVVGGGWAGLAAAVRATELGWRVSLFEASRHWGGRARALPASSGPGLDNGQHILIGAYQSTLDLLRRVGVDLDAAFETLPLDLSHADGSGLAVPHWAARWPQPLDLLAAIALARGWSAADKLALLRASLRWRLSGFACDPALSVAALCADLPARVFAELIEPLCLSALNTPPERASAAVLLRVLKDALFGSGHGRWRGADLLLPRTDLGALLPDPALRWLAGRGAELHTGQRIESLQRSGSGWQLAGARFDAVALACPAREAARLADGAQGLSGADAQAVARWAALASALEYEPIATVYAQTDAARPLPQGRSMLALRGGPAQFVFDRGRLGGPQGLLAFVVSAGGSDRERLEQGALAQASDQLGLNGLRLLRTVVEKRATFACRPGLQRPGMRIASGLLAAGDHVAGPYPATLEGAVRSGLQAAEALSAHLSP